MTKQDFVQEFGQLLKRADINNVDHIEWDDVEEEATVYYIGGHCKKINCAMDSLWAYLTT